MLTFSSLLSLCRMPNSSCTTSGARPKDGSSSSIRRGRPAGERPTVETDVAGRAHETGESAKRRRLAGAVGPEQRGDAALGDAEVETEQRLGVAVIGAKAGGLEQRRGHFSVPR